MPARLNGSTSGYTELTAPPVEGNNTLTLTTGNGSTDQVLNGILEIETTPPETPPTLEENLAKIGATVDELQAAILGGGQ